jgi:hypothetical protein
MYFVGVNERMYDSERDVNRLDSEELSNLCNSLQISRLFELGGGEFKTQREAGIGFSPIRGGQKKD